MTRANDMCIVSTRWKTLASLESMIHFYFDEYETCLNIRPTNLHCCSSNENLPLIFSKRLKSARTSTKPQLSESLLTELQTIWSAWQWINKMWFDWSKNFFQNVTYHRELFYVRDLGARSDKKLVDLSKSFNNYFIGKRVPGKVLLYRRRIMTLSLVVSYFSFEWCVILWSWITLW